MNKVYYVIVALLILTSCANSYNIVGTSNVSNLDGRKHLTLATSFMVNSTSLAR